MIDRIYYRKTFSIGPYLTEHLGAEASVFEGDDPAEEVKKIRAQVEVWHKEANPHLQESLSSIKEDELDIEYEDFKKFIIGLDSREQAEKLLSASEKYHNVLELKQIIKNKLIQTREYKIDI